MAKKHRFSVLFVCLGNVIRSPTCEGLLRTRVQPSVFVDSAACTRHDVGQNPEDHAQTVCKEHGFDISRHVARMITDDDFQKFDLIVSLESFVHDSLEEIRPPGSRATLCEFIPGVDVDNPWWQPYSAFVKMYNQIENGMNAFLDAHVPREFRK
jgi:protein-tyrosine phosphatase